MCTYTYIFVLKDSKPLPDSFPLGVYGAKKVHPATDVPISRTTTVAQLYHIILALFPHLNRKPYIENKSKDLPMLSSEDRNSIEGSFPEGELISIAKGSATGVHLLC
jgi:hypothetical protein